MHNVKDSAFYAISFDESLNTVIQMGQMDIVVNVCDNIVNKVCTRYHDSTFIAHVRHRDLFEQSISALDSLDLKKLLQLSMNGSNVNWAFFSELRNYRTKNDMSKLLSTGSCGLFHTGSIHGAFKTGEQSTDWKLKKVLGTLHQILHDSPARRKDYVDVTWSSRFPLPFCGKRWIEDGQVAVWAIEIWDDICQLCTFWQSLPRSKRPSSQSYLTLLSATKDPLILAKLHFFSCIAGTMKPLLTGYQYTKPMMPFMYGDLHQLLRHIVSKYIKPETVEKCKTASILFNVNFSDKNLFEE